MDDDKCPLCAVSLLADPIPQEYIDAGWYGDSTHYRRGIGYSAHDHIQFWICPDCGGTWNRWQPDSHMWERAEKLRQEYVNS